MTEYIDLILLGAVAIAVIPTVYHYIQSTIRARKVRNAQLVDDETVQELVLHPDDFEKKPE